MGEHADYLTDDQENLYFDHLAGHPNFPCDYCPYCDKAQYIETRQKQREEMK
jgi:hypothetical protein